MGHPNTLWGSFGAWGTDERPLKLAVIITGFWRTHGICGGEGDGGGGGGGGGGSGRESERVAAGTGQARLFMIGSEEEQK